jgi:zinc protease
MTSVLRTFLISLCLTTAAAAAQPKALVAPKLNFEKYTLPNGLVVILVEDKRLPLVAVNLWYHVGPANEKPGRTGFAHLFEHMMFQGSKNVASDSHLRLLEGAGASDLNGTTNFDRTNYFETVPSNQLELALWLESDRMGFLLETLDQSKLTNQQDVVRNERRQSVENRPYGLVDEAVYHALFPQGHPYYASVMGSHADIESVRLADVREFFREYYVPNNASLAIVGDIDKAQVRALVTKYFGPIPAGQPVQKAQVTTPAITAERRIVVTDKVELPRVVMSWLTPAIFTAGDAQADVLGDILGGGKSSRLYQKLVHEQQIAQDVSASQYSLQLGSVFTIEATARPGVKPEQLEKAIDAELAILRAQGPTQAELERARNTLVSQVIRGLETLGGFGGVADVLNRYNHYLGNPDYLQKDMARYQKLDPAALRLAANKLLRSDARLVAYAVPGEKTLFDVPRGQPPTDATPITTTAKDWRAVVPASGPVSTLHLPVPQQFKLGNGLTVMLFEQHKLPVISANLVVLAGSDQNPAGKPGLASFTADLLDEGTSTRSNLQIAQDLATLGTSLGGGSTSDQSSLSIRSLTTTADASFAILADVIRNPVFAGEEIERVRTSRQTALVQQRDNPAAIAQRAFSEALYGLNHPYGFTELGTTASLGSIARNDLVNFWKQGYAPGNSALVVAGDISVKDLRALAEKHFGTWTGSASSRSLAQAEQVTKGRTLVIDKGAAPQTALRIGEIGVSRSSADFVPLTVMNDALGGLFSSRINLNLREKNGYTYGASSGFGFRRGAGPFVVGTNVRTDVTAPAVREIFAEIERVRVEPISEDELRTSRDSFARSLPGQFETSADAAASGSQLFVYGLPLDYYDHLPARIDAVSVADVQRVARQYLDPAIMVTVAVGDRSKIEPALRELNQSPVEVRDIE